MRIKQMNSLLILFVANLLSITVNAQKVGVNKDNILSVVKVIAKIEKEE